MTDKAHRIPEDFALTDERRAIAEKRGLDADKAFEDFVCYWSNLKGHKAEKFNWHKTWINGCNNYEHWGKFKKKDEPIPPQPMKIAPRVVARADILDAPEKPRSISKGDIDQLRKLVSGSLKTLQ